MTPERWHRMTQLFQAAIGRSPDQRPAFLDEACAGDPELRRGAERLVRAHENAGEFIDGSMFTDGVRLLADDEGLPPGHRIGPYRLVRELGHGGMGNVYLAERADDQFEKRVAIKVVKRGMDTAAVLGLFRHERQILAALEHPNIARLFDGGTTDDGRPYFVMEYIEGTPIHDYCDAHALPVNDRLRLFQRVCAAVSYAHQHLVVHRDIKPSNILVAAAGEPKLLDFGIAKMMHAESGHDTLATAGAFRPMTPEYASPEQVRGLPSTTLSDVYSLGVLLYELLVGRPPFGFATRTPEEVARIIATVDPPRPSDLLGRKAAAGQPDQPVPVEGVSAARATTPDRLRRQVHGDLDTIVLTALRRDRDRRYQSVEQFSEDISRHLTGLPIRARRDAALYRTVKFIRRNRLAAGAVAVVFATLVIGMAATSWEAIRASRAEKAALVERNRATAAELGATSERDRALRAEQVATSERVRAEQERNRAVEASKRADSQSAVARAVSDFLQNDLLAQADSRAQAGPTTKADPNLTIRGALDRAAGRIAGKFDADPTIEASVRQTIGMTYRALTLYSEAEPQLERAVELRRRLLGAHHAETLSSMQELGVLYLLQGKNGPADALLTKVLAAQRRLLGGDNPDTLNTMNSLATVVSAEGRRAEAEELFKRLLRIERRLHGDEHRDTLSVMNNLVSEYSNEGKYAEAAELDEKVVATMRRVLGEEHPSTLLSTNNLGVIYRNQGKYAEAETLLTAVLDARRRVVGPDHLDTLASLNSVALVYQAQGKYAQAEPLLLQGLEARRRVLGPEHPQTVLVMNNLAELYRREGRQKEAETLFTQVLELRRRVLGSDHPNTAIVLTTLATIKLDQHEPAEAETFLREGLNAYQKRAPDSWQRYYTQSLLGASLTGRGLHAEAEPLLISGYQGMIERRESIPVENRQKLDDVKGWIVQLYQEWGKPEQALAWRDGTPRR
jgi:serine/threonine protein kinase/tetratricopeptide (TPR) repeat protein